MPPAEPRIPAYDPSAEVDALLGETLGAVERVLKSGQFILGPEVEAFESEVAGYLGVRHAVAVNSGTDALLIALRAAGVGQGDEVVVPAFTFVATASAVLLAGAKPVFADVDAETLTLSADQVAAHLTERTRAVIPVHLYGHPADLDGIRRVLPGRVQVIEDVAQAFGGQWQGKRLGSLGLASAFSFFPTKNLGAYGDGGLVATDDSKTAQTARVLRAHGARRKYFSEQVGYNSRLDAIQAAILRTKLKHVDAWNESRRGAAARYRDLLRDVKGLTLPVERPGATHVFHQFTVRVLAGRRDHVRESLEREGISTMIYYPVPLHLTQLFKDGPSPSLAESEKAATEVLSLPLWPRIDRAIQSRVANALGHALTD